MPFTGVFLTTEPGEFLRVDLVGLVAPQFRSAVTSSLKRIDDRHDVAGAVERMSRRLMIGSRRLETNMNLLDMKRAKPAAEQFKMSCRPTL